ncbi:unnamed protein product [Cyclocybe aegerita]|uniref:Uncharacterized protein n=1 Tax=Cyclocybe aegerita TaxID=1973307 RepID=A0A8S0VRS5_CYCAE|nr:unnamed protein product [Cyclocybe aegerita]
MMLNIIDLCLSPPPPSPPHCEAALKHEGKENPIDIHDDTTKPLSPSPRNRDNDNRYLGFYFDRRLTFHEHVCYYATKAFTTVQAMRMLGNSTRGLSPKQRKLLYRSCVVPIATYGYRLWYFDGACNKGVMNQLKWMQQKAALWITGAFRTSPTGGLKALAGLIPIHRMLKKLATHAVYRVATLFAP